MSPESNPCFYWTGPFGRLEFCLHSLILLLQVLSRKSTRISPNFKMTSCHYRIPVIDTLPCSQPWPLDDFVASSCQMICRMKSKTSNSQPSISVTLYSYHFLSQLSVARVSSRRSFTLRTLSFGARTSTRSQATPGTASSTFITFETNHSKPATITSHATGSQHHL